jgi:LDH2 family malate/lactate/ureidoglycolate dehydrogenase
VPTPFEDGPDNPVSESALRQYALLPGQAALSRKAAAETHGLELYAGIADELNALADRFHRSKPPLLPKNRPNPR